MLKGIIIQLLGVNIVYNSIIYCICYDTGKARRWEMPGQHQNFPFSNQK